MDGKELREEIVKKLQTIYDPELPVNIWDLGLIYEVNIFPNNEIEIVMTLTTPNCPVAHSLPLDVENVVKEVEGVGKVSVEITWFPTWNKDMMSEEALLELGFL